MSNILAQRAAQKAAELEEADQSFEAKHGRAMSRLNNQMATRVASVRYVGPPEPKISELHQTFVRNRTRDMGISRCRWCDPEPQTWKCPLCDQEFQDKWRIWLHNVTNPKWCQDRAAKKTREWSRHA